MALINGMYINVTDEDITRTSELSSHSVEEGIDVTDTVRPQPIEISLSGKLVYYEGYSAAAVENNNYITAWISIVKKDGSAFETMSFERLNNEIIAFDGDVSYVDTGAIFYLDSSGAAVDVITNGSSSEVYNVKLEIRIKYGSTVRVQNAYTEWVCFNIVNKSTTGYNVRDYDADAAELSDIVLSNTYNGEAGRVRTSFTNYDDNGTTGITPDITRGADWVLEQLTTLWQTGALVTFEGRNYFGNYQISELDTSHPNTVSGGADFTMRLKEFRGAKNSYSTNENIATLGMQQISNGGNEQVYYTVQTGDTVYSLVAADDAPYRNLTRSGETTPEAWVLANNPSAFSVAGDVTSLIAGSSLYVGDR